MLSTASELAVFLDDVVNRDRRLRGRIVDGLLRLCGLAGGTACASAPLPAFVVVGEFISATLLPQCSVRCPRSGHLFRRDQHFCRHPRHQRARIVQPHFENNRLERRACACCFGRRVAVWRNLPPPLEENFAAGNTAAGHPDAQHIAVADVVGVGFPESPPAPRCP